MKILLFILGFFDCKNANVHIDDDTRFKKKQLQNNFV